MASHSGSGASAPTLTLILNTVVKLLKHMYF